MNRSCQRNIFAFKPKTVLKLCKQIRKIHLLNLYTLDITRAKQFCTRMANGVRLQIAREGQAVSHMLSPSMITQIEGVNKGGERNNRAM